ncbi:MAG: translation elongation factor Ts [Verrucomicrobia bacterium]|nr:translation elongation factor Ts [Verrucomicrobiota bacterium]
MPEITASLVKELREATNVSMMECKRALVESSGDIGQATKLLRERGVAVAAKRAGREANQGLIASHTLDDGRGASLVEVNCETDFVARNDNFVAFVNDLAARAAQTDAKLADEVTAELTAKIAEIGENIVCRRNVRFTVQGEGAIGSYIHLGGKVGVLVELGCSKAATTGTDAFQALLRDLTLQIAAASPRYLNADEVAADEVAAEREIYANQVKDKPEQIVAKIVDGKMRKFFEEICLVDQGFVKEPKQTIKDLVAETAKSVGDDLTIRRFVRYQIGA